MEAGMMTYTFEEGSLAPLIERAIDGDDPSCRSQEDQPQAKVDEKLPVLKMDRERILQVLRNLIGNAVKFTPEGGQIRVSARLVNREVEVSVTDTGPGIPRGKSNDHL